MSVMMVSKAICEGSSRGALCPDTHPQLPLLKILGSAVYSASSFPSCDRVGSKVSALNGAACGREACNPEVASTDSAAIVPVLTWSEMVTRTDWALAMNVSLLKASPFAISAVEARGSVVWWVGAGLEGMEGKGRSGRRLARLEISLEGKAEAEGRPGRGRGREQTEGRRVEAELSLTLKPGAFEPWLPGWLPSRQFLPIHLKLASSSNTKESSIVSVRRVLQITCS